MDLTELFTSTDFDDVKPLLVSTLSFSQGRVLTHRKLEAMNLENQIRFVKNRGQGCIDMLLFKYYCYLCCNILAIILR